jgi:hypothetical protein
MKRSSFTPARFNLTRKILPQTEHPVTTKSGFAPMKSILRSDDQVAEARTYRFPSLNLYALGSQLLTPVDFTFQRGAFGSFPGIGPVPATDTRIHTPLRPTFYGLTQFSQPLSQQYKIGLNIKQAKLAKLVDEQKLRAQKQS